METPALYQTDDKQHQKNYKTSRSNAVTTIMPNEMETTMKEQQQQQSQQTANQQLQQQQQQQHQAQQQQGQQQHHDALPFFNETLDLSQEDIQRTLSANMPMNNHSVADDTINGDINPMDFIENCHNPGTDDDVFVNLDAFDMLVEFPDLELDAKNSFLQVCYS